MGVVPKRLKTQANSWKVLSFLHPNKISTEYHHGCLASTFKTYYEADYHQFHGLSRDINMPCKLRPLILPQLVEAQARQPSLSSDYDIESPELSASLRTQNSSASDFPSPVTPNFSARHRQTSSPGSSADAMHLSGLKTSPCHDRFDSFGSAKCYLPDVEEEALEVNEDEQYDLFSSPLDCSCYDCGQSGNDATRSFVVLPSTIEYDLTDSFWSDGDFSPNLQAKKHRAEGFASIATRLSNKLPSLPKRWKSKKSSVQTSTADNLREAISTHTAESQSLSSSGSITQSPGGQFGMQMPPSPARSVLDEEDEESYKISPVDTRNPHKYSSSWDGIATTPLLPPLLIPGSSTPLESPIQSPLQSPTVAELREPFSIVNTPANTPTTPQTKECSSAGRPPTPPLSTHASISSFHRHKPGHLVPSNEIPPILIGDSDEWANRLGHANFNIQPEPYLPEAFDLAACKQIRANWDLARCNFAKHLVRMGEHYGITSKTYRLTEEKWTEIDSQWRRYDEITISKTAEENGVNAVMLSEAAATPMALMKIPSLNDPRSEGKFPKLGDEDIVGPMVQFASQLQRKPSKKAAFLKFLQDVKFPSGVMRPSSSDDRVGS
ncbi:hypothetical protein FGG08_002083 [Glutinoglossum americanum]|uniref:Only prolin and serin are matching in the corresponding protein n=1 Tax=Glutinoglossum americanum TaxID=1670608 RepID=A0A9P8L5V7_9PEZI|nr:hypothetical protein FGG08_002083 [Glutinoglossum americanum]